MKNGHSLENGLAWSIGESKSRVIFLEPANIRIVGRVFVVQGHPLSFFQRGLGAGILPALQLRMPVREGKGTGFVVVTGGIVKPDETVKLRLVGKAGHVDAESTRVNAVFPHVQEDKGAGGTRIVEGG